jgi:hypothetical protein
MIKVLELKGYHSLRALNAFSALMLGIKMLPQYMGEDYDSFMDRVKEMPKEKQRELFKTAARHIELEKGEVEALLCFCTDPNGIPYKAENLGNLNPEKIVDIIVEVCLKIAEIKVDMVTDSEKKN